MDSAPCAGESWAWWVRDSAMRLWWPTAVFVVVGILAADMVGSGNTNPPSIALLAYAATQAGLVLAAGPAATRLLARPRLWHRVARTGRCRGRPGRDLLTGRTPAARARPQALRCGTSVSWMPASLANRSTY